MKTLKIALGMLLAPSLAVADAPRGSSYAGDNNNDTPLPTQTLVEPSTADLQVKQVPPKLTKMRGKEPAKQKTTASTAKTADGVTAAAAGGVESGGSVGYKAFPTTTRDLRERVTFRIRAGLEVDSAPASGDTLRGGFALPDGFADTRPWILGDAAIGARGIITQTLNGYFLSSFAFDASDSLATRTATIMPYDNENIAIKAGYAEYGRDDRKPDGQQPNKFWIRAGRQFRLDGGNLFAYFDGATVGYKDKGFAVSGFAGQRVALYVDTEPGVLFGATAAYDAKKLRINFDYMGLAISSTDFDADGETDGETRHLIGVLAKYDINRQTKLDVRARLTGLPDLEGTAAGEVPATKFALGRVGARVRYEANKLIVIGDLEQRFKDDIAYDLASPSSVDIVDVANKIGVMNTPVDATHLGVQVDWQTSNRKNELFGIANAEIAAGDEPTTVDTRDYVEVGIGWAGTPVGVRGAGVYTTAQYTFRKFTNVGVDGDARIDGVCDNLMDADGDGIPDNCQEFGNSASSGIDNMHQLAVEAIMTTKSNNGKHWRFSAGAFFRAFDFSTPYRVVGGGDGVVTTGGAFDGKADTRGGGRLDLQYWFNRDLHLNVVGELAQSSTSLQREIGTLTSVRAALEARW